VSIVRRIKNKIRRDGFGSLLRSVKINFFYWLEKQVLFRAPRLLPLCFRKPRMIYLELSSLCNLKCKTCFRGERDQGIMRLGLAKKLIVQAARMGGVSLHLGFAGEPLTYPHMLKLLKFLKIYKNRFYKISLTTNGTLLDPKISFPLIKSGVLDWLTFSMDGVGNLF